MVRLTSGLAVISLAAATLMAPAAAETGAQPQTFQTYSLAGSYLAGRSAEGVRDLNAAASFLGNALRLDPDNVYLLERVLILRVATGQLESDTDFDDRLIELDPRNPIARLVRGVQALERGAHAEAEDELASAARTPLLNLVNGLLTGWAKFSAGETDAAIDQVDGLKGPSWYPIFKNFHIALMADLADMGDLAKEAVTEAYDAAEGTSVRIVEAYARIMARHGESDAALEAVDSFLTLRPGDALVNALHDELTSGAPIDPLIEDPMAGAAEVLYALGAAIGSEEATDLPATYFQLALRLRPANELAIQALGEVLARADRCDDAVAVLERIPDDSLFARDASAQMSICLERLGRTDEAVERMRELVSSQPDDLDSVIILGNILRTHERYGEAVEAYSQGIETLETPAPIHWSLYYYRGMSNERAKKWDAAEKDLKKALVLNPGHPHVLNYLGYTWVDMGENLDEGLEMIREAVQKAPNEGFIIDSLGWAYYRLGRYEDAVEQLERAVELKPEDPVINDHLGDAYWKVGRKREALFQWNHARDLDPEPANLEQIVQKLEKGLVENGGSDG